MLVVVLHHIDAHGDGHDNYREVIHEGLARDVRPVLQLDAGGILETSPPPGWSPSLRSWHGGSSANHT